MLLEGDGAEASGDGAARGAGPGAARAESCILLLLEGSPLGGLASSVRAEDPVPVNQGNDTAPEWKKKMSLSIIMGGLKKSG